MKYSYAYEDLLKEIKRDLSEGLINPSDILKVVRSSNKVYLDYYPIIDYYYSDNQPDEPFEFMAANRVLEEMEYHNTIF